MRRKPSGIGKSLRDNRFGSDNPLPVQLSVNIYEAIVNDNVDARGQGRVQAYIPSLNQLPEDSQVYLYASPFGGTTNMTCLLYTSDAADE